MAPDLFQEPKMIQKSIFRWYDPFLLPVIPGLTAALIKGLMRSCRVVRIEGEAAERRALEESNGGAVYVTWHQRMSYLFHFASRRHLAVMISQSRDGEYAARLAHLLGFKSLRGSSTRGGIAALRHMVRRAKQGEVVGMLADGPLGPSRIMKMGALLMAREAHVPLIGLVWGADRCWVFNSWDRYLIPKPVARIVLLYTEPLWIPAHVRGDELESYRCLFEQRLNEGTQKCDLFFGNERPWRKSPSSP